MVAPSTSHYAAPRDSGSQSRLARPDSYLFVEFITPSPRPTLVPQRDMIAQSTEGSHFSFFLSFPFVFVFGFGFVFLRVDTMQWYASFVSDICTSQ
jgi:hypothetical protein